MIRMPALTISIVTYNGVGKIEPCLRSLHAQTFSDFDIIVVDNASSDGTIAAVTNGAPEARIIPLHTNVGFGAGHNRAIRESTTPYVLVLNQDVVLQPTAIEKLMNAAEQSRAAVVGPLLLRPRSSTALPAIVDTAGLKKSWWWHVADRSSGRTVGEREQRSGFLWGISGACALYRRDDLASVAYKGANGLDEYFDEYFFMYKEDVDLAARLRRRGFRAWYEASAVGDHGRTGYAAAKTGQQAEHRRRLPAYVREYSYRNHWFVIIKHAWLWQLPFILVYEVVKLLFLLVTEPRTLRMIPSIVRNTPRMLRRRYA